ncbi:hypothetical protein ACSDR0_24900 [Streptosporangium sp. G11]|uniref:hypothetical protein n=1 Tax=Streptosporangium sp. G11 TaxID=3436926 RepID=UPI003EBF3117
MLLYDQAHNVEGAVVKHASSGLTVRIRTISGPSSELITDKLVIDATTPVAPGTRGHYSRQVCDLPETAAWTAKITAMLSAR